MAIVGVTGVVLTVLFLWQESRAAEPILPLRLFNDRTISAVFAMGFGLMFAVIAVSTFMPFFLQVSRGASATSSGLMLVPQTLGITIMATLSGRLVSHSGRYKWALVAGPLIAFFGLLLLSSIDADTSFAQLAPYLVLMGVGMGLIFPNLTLAVQNAAAMEDLGVATSTANFFRNMGAAFGAAVVGAALNSQLDDALAERLPAGELADLGGAEGLIRSPDVVRDLPPALHDVVVEAVEVSVTSVYRWVAPVALILLVLPLLVHETPLRTTSSIGGATTPSPASPAIAPAEGDVA
jgi:MFS family permease